MKIHVYGVRKEEKASLEHLGGLLDAELSLSEALPSPASAYDAEGCEGVCVSDEGKVDRLILRCWKNIGVKALAIRSESSENVDLEAARETGLKVCGAVSTPRSESELALLMTLACLRRLPEGVFAGRTLYGRTARVLGDEETVQAVLPLLEAFGCLVEGSEAPAEEAPRVPEGRSISRSILSIFRTEESEDKQEPAPQPAEGESAPADIVLVLGPTGEDTPVLDADFFAALKDGTVLVVVGAEDRVDLPILASAIESGRIGALGLDLAAPKQSYLPLQRAAAPEREAALKKLRAMDRVFLTDHLARRTLDAADEICRSALEGLLNLIHGRDCPTKLV